MNDAERQQLADRLSSLSFRQAHREMRKLDPDAVLKYYRNTMWDEYHTLWLLPNKDLAITLVEKSDSDTLNQREYGAPPWKRRLGVSYRYVGARVEPLKRPVAKF